MGSRGPAGERVRVDEGRRVSQVAAGLVGSEILKIAADVRELKAAGREVLDLTVGDFSSAQFRIPGALELRLVSALRAGETHYPPSNGVLSLRQAVVELFRNELSTEVPLEGVVIAGGSRPLIYATYRALLDPGDRVVFPVPSWNNNHYVHLTGAVPVTVEARPETDFLPVAEDLAPALRDARLLALCSPLNPTGTAFSVESLGEICDAVLAENARRGPEARPLYLMYDQVYWMLTASGVDHHHPLALRPAMAPYTIYVDGISKAFAATGIRVGWSVGPPDVIGRMSDILGHVGAWAPRAEQIAVAGYLGDPGPLEAFRRDFQAGVFARLQALSEGFQEMAAAGLPVRTLPPMGAIYLSVQVDAIGRTTPEGERLDSNDALRRYLLERAGVALVPFQSFAYPHDSGWFRCSVGAVGRDEIRRALPAVGSALAALR